MSDRRVAVITGSSRGVGASLARHFLAAGYAVAGCSREEGAIEHEHYRHRQVDVGLEGQVVDWIRRTGRDEGRIDVVVNNAGVAPAALVLMASAASLDATMRTNVTGPFVVSREAAKFMIKRRTGSVINISSIITGLHGEGAAAYAASKAALVEFSKVFAKEMAPFGVRCNVVALPFVETEMLVKLSPQAHARYQDAHVFRRPATPAEIGDLVEFLASPTSAGVTGQVIHVGYVD